MAKDFNYTTSDEQIAHLRGKGLIFDNEANAKVPYIQMYIPGNIQ